MLEKQSKHHPVTPTNVSGVPLRFRTYFKDKEEEFKSIWQPFLNFVKNMILLEDSNVDHFLHGIPNLCLTLKIVLFTISVLLMPNEWDFCS